MSALVQVLIGVAAPLALVGAWFWFVCWYTKYPPIPHDPSYRDERR